MTRTRFLTCLAPLSLLALGLTVPAAVSAQSAQDFQLPPNPTPTPSGPQVQGPVDEGVLPPTNSPSTPTASPTASPAATPTAQTTPTPRLSVTPTPIRTRPTPAATTAVRQRPAPAQTTSQPAPTATPDNGVVEAPSATSDAVAPTADSPTALPSGIGAGPATTETGSDSSFPWAWLAALAAALAALGGFLFWRRKQGDIAPALIEPPKIPGASVPAANPVDAKGSATRSSTAPTPAPVAPTPSADWLKIEARVSELQRSMMNTTLRYKLVIANRSGSVLEDVSVEADLATAHNRVPVGEQLASPETQLTVRDTITRMAPGERVELEGEIMIPLRDVKIITQGKALLCVPLLRVRITHEAGGRKPMARTWVVGRTTPEGQGKLNPFRFDAPPQNYSDIGQRPLD